ncbi:GRAM domain-containing YSP2 [Gossypium arboreum]|uniref:GRAM domain-containing YSP2 n=1 Tax=Gossypium arboreum TaxID=29729 RepID=A0A0B0NCM5_GOSAR|nr:GRAM domain-containing YSP2 [Gossypium arboreum]
MTKALSGTLHRYMTACKTTFGTLALYDLCDYLSVLSNFEWFIRQRYNEFECIKQAICQV